MMLRGHLAIPRLRGYPPGVRPLALVVLLAARASAQAAEPASAPVAKRPYAVVYEKGVDKAGAERILGTLDRVLLEWPALGTKEVLGTVVFVSPDRKLDNARYCAGTAYCEGVTTPKTILVDVPFVLAFVSNYPDYYRAGVGEEAVLFHELIHGWGHARPGKLEDYAVNASDGRRTAFVRSSHKVFKHLWPLERVMAGAEWRKRIGTDTRSQWLARNERQWQRKTWRMARRIRLEDADAIIAKYRAKHDKVIASFTAKANSPRRSGSDVHALDNDQEWFAYGAEIAFYTTQAEALLTAEERAWWKTAASELKGGPPAAAVADTHDEE